MRISDWSSDVCSSDLKALLQSSEKYADASRHFAAHGIKVEGLGLDLAAMMGRKDKVVKDLTGGIEFLFKKNKIDYVKGWGAIPAAGKVTVKLEAGGEETLERSEERRVGKECVSTCRYRWSQYH